MSLGKDVLILYSFLMRRSFKRSFCKHIIFQRSLQEFSFRDPAGSCGALVKRSLKRVLNKKIL
jgi:hypothetical protein